MENIVYSALGKLFTILFFLVDAVAAKDICYETSTYQYYCEEGKECCKSNTACCDTSDGNIAVIFAISAVCGFVLLMVLVGLCTWFLARRYCKPKVGPDGEPEPPHGTSSQDNNVREDQLQECCFSLMELLCCETREGRCLCVICAGSSSQDNNVQENQLREQLPRRIQTVQITAAQREVNGSSTALAYDRVMEEPYNTRFDNSRYSDLLHV